MLIRTHLRNTNIPILAHHKRTHTHTHTTHTNTHTHTYKHTPQCRGESLKPAHARAHPCTHTHTHTPPHTIHKLFLDFREIEKNCTKIEKSLVSERWGCEYIGTFDSEIKCSQSLNQIKMLKDCLVHHVYCAHLGTPWHRALTAFCAVSYRESRYTRTHYGCDLESLRVYFLCGICE